MCDVLNRRARKQGIKIRAEGIASKTLNLIFVTVIFGEGQKAYSESSGDDKLWKALERVSDAAKRTDGLLNYLRGFSYFDSDRLHMLKPATMKNWCQAAALNDADAIFEHLVSRQTT